MNSPENPPRFSDDPAKNRARQELLAKLAANARNPAMAELARELLAGNVTPRRVMESHLYADVLEAPANDFAAWYSGLSETEKDAEAAKGEDTIRELSEAPREEPPLVPTRKPATSFRRAEDDEYIEDFSEQDWLDG